MLKHQYLGKPRRGAVAPLVAVSLVAVLSIVAIALDGGLMLDSRRQLQASALAAAADLYNNYMYYSGKDTPGTANESALSTAVANGFDNDNSTNTVTVNIPPQSGDHIGQAGYAEVIIQYNMTRGFSSIFGTGNIPITARAVARGRWVASQDGIIVLDPTDSGSLSANGNGTVSVIGAPMIVDSNAFNGATTVGNSFITDAHFYFTGTPGYTGNFQGAISSGVPPTPDPLAYLPEPDPSTMTTQSRVKLSGMDSATINPGVYPSIDVSGQASLTMNPGIYYMNGGGFSFAGQGNLTANGVMIYNTGGGAISITGLGVISMSPPTTGIYQGLTLFQDRTSNQAISVAGNGSSSITGTFYAALASASVQGNGASSIASQVVSYQMSAGGNGAINIIWDVNLVPRIRQLQLVE